MVGIWQTRILLIARFIHGSLGRFLGARPSSPSRGHVAQPEGFRGLARAPRPGDTWLTRKVSGSLLVFPVPGTRGSTGRVLGARQCFPPGDTWLTRKVFGSSPVFPIPGTRGSLERFPGAR